MSHLARPALATRFPVHVTLRMQPHVWNLRSRRSFRVIGTAVREAAGRFGMRICEFSVQGNHLHLVVEASGREALARGMQGLGIRLGKGLNRLMGRHGRVLADRYHAHILRTLREVQNAVRYVRDNHARHARNWSPPSVGPTEADPYSSAGCADLAWWRAERRRPIELPEPGTWMLTRARDQLAQSAPATLPLVVATEVDSASMTRTGTNRTYFTRLTCG
jgi:REP element-mobilizing transposase RayT